MTPPNHRPAIERARDDRRPYCVTIFDRNTLRSKPYGNRRFASIEAANTWISRTVNPDRFMIDLASAFPAIRTTKDAENG